MAPRYRTHFTPRQQTKFTRVLREFKYHTLHSGSKRGPLVFNHRQALAIAFSEANAAKRRRRHR